MSTKKHLIQAAGVVGLMTLASRILGMIRDIVSAERFGTSWQWDAFLYAFMLPNFLRRIVGEGALSSAFIPVYTETLEKEGDRPAFRLGNIILTLLGTALLAFLFIVEMVIKGTLHSGFGIPDRLRLTLELLQYLSPYLWFISMFGIGMGILNCHRHFFAPALGPLILDVFWIAAVLCAVRFAGANVEAQLHFLSFIVFISGAVQLAAEVPYLYKTGFRFRWVWDIAHEGLKKTGRLLLPSLMGFAIVQINLFVDSTIGIMIGAGANSSLWYGSRMMQFPLGVFAIALGTALLPMISRQSAAGDLEGAKKTISFALRTVFLIILPCSVGLIVLRAPIIQLLFERGEFDAVSTARSANVLLFYTIGLVAFSGQKLITTGFYAVQDSKTPVKLGVVALISNIIFNLILMIPMREAGLALATSLSGILQFLLLLRTYHRKVGRLPFREIGSAFLKILAASLCMGFVCIGMFHFLEHLYPLDSLAHQFIRAFGAMGISVMAYVFFCFLFRVHEMKEAWQWAAQKRVR